ncbi:MAG TPA: hypothetical protein VKX45_20385 [Bryobacteraceae bacterium]|jgi:hypothetical protein|nr:hypothetical protein [Bryobacteraceae bacterium]
MPFQWLEMRIAEERDRRRREAEIHARLAPAMEELHRLLAGCLDAYNREFGVAAATIAADARGFTIRVEEPPGEVRVDAVQDLPGFHIRRGETVLPVEIGLLPGAKLFYRDQQADQYLTMDELTRKILDRVLFPKLRE